MVTGERVCLAHPALVVSGLMRANSASRAEKKFGITHTEAEWRGMLTPEQYSVLCWEAGTEYPFTSPLNTEHRKGIFACAGCDLDSHPMPVTAAPDGRVSGSH